MRAFLSAGRVRALTIISILLALQPIQSGFAAQPPKDSFKFTELVTQHVVNTRSAGSSTVVHTLVTPDTFTISALIDLTGSSEPSISATTVFALSVGGYSISHELGDDKTYNARKTTATFVDSYTEIVNGRNKKVVYQTTRLHWTSTYLSASVVAHTTDLASPDWASILANIYIGSPNGPVANSISGSVTFGGAGDIFDPIPVTGRIRETSVTEADKTKITETTVSLTAKAGTVEPAFTALLVVPGSDTPQGSTTATNLLGGTLTISSGPLAGVTVTIPPGAVASDTQFSVSSNDLTLIPNAGTFPGQGLSLDSGGQTTFQQPLEITVPFPDDGTIIPVPYYVDSDNHLEPCQVVSIDHVGHTITFLSFHASLYTWIFASLAESPASVTTYEPGVDGFQIVNNGSVYNPDNEGFGMCAFEQWYFQKHDGGLYSKYWQDIPVPSGGTVKGQNIIATRAQTSVVQYWNNYWSNIALQQNLSNGEQLALIENTLSNTASPTILYLRGISGGSTVAHAVLAYNCNSNGILINDPNAPGEGLMISATNPVYGIYTSIMELGNGSLQKEAFDAEAGFDGNGAAQVLVTSSTDYQVFTDSDALLSGNITSGQVLVDDLVVWLNGVSSYEQQIDTTGAFNISPLFLNSGTNDVTFETRGHDEYGNVIEAPNTQLAPFHMIYTGSSSSSGTGDAVILATLTWNTNGTDLDLYTLDPNYATDSAGFSAFYNKVTDDGGALDFDNTTGYGPEHWTLLNTDNIQWGGAYQFRVHYYDDHTNPNPGPAIPTQWTVTITLYQGTPNSVTTSYSGELSYHYAYNCDPPTSTGPDWADVATITPVQALAGANLTPTVTRSANGAVHITVPISPKLLKKPVHPRQALP